MKVGGDQVVLVPRLSIFGGDASHGSHRVVAPMSVTLYRIGLVVNFCEKLAISLKWSNAETVCISSLQW